MADLRALLAPRSLVLVGASPDPGIIRGRMVRAVIESGFPGPVYFLSRTHAEIAGRATYRDVDSLPETPDLAIVSVPAAVVPEALEACGRRGIRAAAIISSGFAEEPGEEGAARQRAVSEIAARHDMAVTGPNSEGLFNANLPLAASFSPAVMELAAPPVAGAAGGAIAVTSQSGGVGFSFLDRGRALGLDFSHVVSTGNEAGVESLEVAAHLLEDPGIRVVIMFIEGVRTPARLPAIARRALELGKPLVAVKVGRSEAGRLAAMSHTASMVGAARAYDAVMRRYGIAAASDHEEALAAAAVLGHFHDCLPAGPRVAVVTPSGGAGIWLADHCERAGLVVPPLDDRTRARLDAVMPAYGVSRNPIDVTAQVIHQLGYAGPAGMVVDSPAIDAVVVVVSLINPGRILADLPALEELRARLDKPVVFWSYTRAHPDAVAGLARAGYPCLTSVAATAWALGAAVRLAAVGLAAVGLAAVDLAAARETSRDSMPARAAPPLEAPPALGEEGVLVEAEAKDWLASHGLPVPRDGCRDMLQRLRGYRLLEGADVDALLDLLEAVARIADGARGWLGSMDLNPILVHRRGEGATIVDAWVERIEPGKEKR